METIRILLVCGSGASSGFMAANIRKAAAERGLNVSVTARGESEIENYVDEIDVLMVGPHLAYIMDEVDDYVGDRPIAVILMDPDYYSTLDGNAAVEHLIKALTEDED